MFHSGIAWHETGLKKGKNTVFMQLLRRSFIKQTFKVRKRAKIRNRYNQAPHLTQDTNGKVTTSQKGITNESQEVSPFPAGDNKVSTNKNPQHLHEEEILLRKDLSFL